MGQCKGITISDTRWAARQGRATRVRPSRTTFNEQLTWTRPKTFYKASGMNSKGRCDMEELSGVLLQKYGYNKAKADAEIDNW